MITRTTKSKCESKIQTKICHPDRSIPFPKGMEAKWRDLLCLRLHRAQFALLP